MNIPSSYYVIIDVIIVLIFVLCFVFSYKNGIIYEFVSLFLFIISGFLGYFLSPILAKRFFLIKPELQDNPLINTQTIYFTINVVVWFVVITIFFILLFTLIKPLFKTLTKIPVVGWVDKVFGLIFGLLKGLILCTLLSCILSTAFYEDYPNIKEGTIIKYVDQFSTKAISFVINNIDYKKIDENISDIDIENTQKIFEEWLVNKGIIDE